MNTLKTILLALLFWPFCQAHAQSKPDFAALASFMEGDYTLIGRAPDSHATYDGRLLLHANGEHLTFVRKVGRHVEKGPASFDTIADGIPVLRMQFTLRGKKYNGMYVWSSDYDNECRLTGYVSLPSNETKDAGLEALFPAATSSRRGD